MTHLAVANVPELSHDSLFGMLTVPCVVCGRKIRGNAFKIYSNPKNKELKLYVCTEHKEYIKALDSLELPSTENNP